MLRKLREVVNPPYSAKDILLILATLAILIIAIPLTVLAAQQARELASRATQTKEKQVTISSQVLDQSYIPDQLFIQFKPGVDKKSKERIYKIYKLSKLTQAKGQEKYNVQLVQVDPKKAKQTIRVLSKNKRVEKVDYIQIPHSDLPLVSNSNVEGIVTPAFATDLEEVLITPEGVRIEDYTPLTTVDEIYNVLKANANSLIEIGPNLKVSVDEYAEAGRGFAQFSRNGSFSGWVKLVAESYVLAPNRNMGHEYGHIHGWYWNWKLWGKSWNKYLEARGLLGDPRINSNYAWRPSELYAEDYRQLLAAPEAWFESQYQFNIEVPLATEVQGLKNFLCTIWQGKSTNTDGRCGKDSQTDTQAPTISITSPTSGATVSGLVDVGASATDNVGVTKVELYVNGKLFATDLTSPYIFSWDTTVVSNGNHTLSAKAYDGAGNSKTSSTVTVTVSNTTTDTEAPVVSITSPSEGQTVFGKIFVSATATDNVGVTKAELYVDNKLRGTDTSAPYSFPLDTTTLTNGVHNLEVRATDSAGNVGFSGLVSVNVNNGVADTQAPVVKITAPADGSTTSKNSVKIKVSATDNVKVTRVEIYIDGALKKTFTGSSRYQYNWNTKKYLSGTHLITAKAYDGVGNTSATSIAVVKK